MLLIIDWQHQGKPGNLNDTGAWGDLNHDGKPSLEESEAAWTGALALHLWHGARQRGWQTLSLADGWYADRHKRVNNYLSALSISVPDAVYLALHFNAGGGKYGSFFYDHRSPTENGRALGRELAGAVSAGVPALRDARIWPAGEVGAVGGEWSRAFGTISGIGARAVAICCEPAFLDQPAHAQVFTPEGVSLLADAMIVGIHNWKKGR